MLWLERRVVDAIMTEQHPDRQRAIRDYVDGCLAAMPAHLRLGVAGESVILGTPLRLAAVIGRLDASAMRRAIGRLGRAPVDVVRQYVRVLSSLVVFAEHELPPAASPATATTELRGG